MVGGKGKRTMKKSREISRKGGEGRGKGGGESGVGGSRERGRREWEERERSSRD